MNRETTANDQSRDDGEVRAFFDQWHVYDVIIRNDYMSHRGIHAALRKFLQEFAPGSFKVLDLGCGDASRISETLSGLPVDEYVGVDLSPVALDLARKNFAKTGFALRLLEFELGDFLSQPHDRSMDVVLAGFVLHHYTDEEKAQFFTRCATLLGPGGHLLLYDVFCGAGETREQLVESYCKDIQNHWTALSPAERTSTCSHVRSSDFPVTYDYLAGLARKAGFSAPSRPLFADDGGHHCLGHFERPAAGNTG